MTREEQKRCKELKKYIDTKSKTIAKEYGLKKKDYIFYTTKNKMFYSIVLHSVENRLLVHFHAKPFWLDDILWDILQLCENKNQPISLRGTGAFTINARIREEVIVLDDFDIANAVLESVFDKFNMFINEFDEECFINEIQNIVYQKEMIEVISFIKKQEYKHAFDYVNANKIDSFQVGEKDFSDLTKNYLKGRI